MSGPLDALASCSSPLPTRSPKLCVDLVVCILTAVALVDGNEHCLEMSLRWSKVPDEVRCNLIKSVIAGDQ